MYERLDMLVFSFLVFCFSFVLSFFSRNRVLLGIKVYVNYVKFMLNFNLFFVKICYVKICKDDNMDSYLNITVQIYYCF